MSAAHALPPITHFAIHNSLFDIHHFPSSIFLSSIFIGSIPSRLAQQPIYLPHYGCQTDAAGDTSCGQRDCGYLEPGTSGQLPGARPEVELPVRFVPRGIDGQASPRPLIRAGGCQAARDFAGGRLRDQN